MSNLSISIPTLESIEQVYDRLSQASTAVAVAALTVFDLKHKLEQERAEIINSGALWDKTKYSNEAAREAALSVLTADTAYKLHEAEISLQQNKIDLREAEIERDRLEMVMKWAGLKVQVTPANGWRTPPAGPPLTDDLIKDQEGYIRAMAAGGILPLGSMPLDDKPPSA